MNPLPLHPAIVHLPLGLAFVMPALAIGFAWAVWTGRLQPRAWVAIVALQAVLLAGGLAAINTGEREEERVERVVPDASLERHEALATQFVVVTGATFAVALLALAFRRPNVRRALTAATSVGTVLVTVAAIRVGHAGGQLVYRDNAGAAYATARPAATSADEARRAGVDDDDRR